MPIKFFNRTTADPVALKKPAFEATAPSVTKQPATYQMTGWDWAFSIGSFGLYYWCVIRPKKAQAQEQMSPPTVKPPLQPESKVHKPEAPAEKTDPWQGIFAKLCLLQEPLDASLESGVSENFDAFQNLVATCNRYDFLKPACSAFRSDSAKDAFTRQLDFINALYEAAKLAPLTTTSHASHSFKELVELRKKYTQLRTKLIFKQSSEALNAPLQQPQIALNNLEAQLKQLTTDTPSFRKSLDESLDEKPYDKNALPDLSVQNDPIQYLKKRIEEFNAIQRHLQATLTSCGIDLTIAECPLTEIADTQEHAEEKLKAALAKTHGNTLTVLQQLKDKPVCAAAANEISAIIKDYSPILEEIKQGAALAATYRQAQLRHTIRQNPALWAYYEELKRLLQCKIIGAAAASSGEVTAAKSAELTIIEEAALAIQQLPLPGVGFAASVLSCIYGYVEQVRQGTKLNNILQWQSHLGDKNWLEEFALLATLAKREEILGFAAKAQAEVDETKKIKTLEKTTADLQSAISTQTSTTKQLQQTAKTAEKICAQKESDFKKRSVSLNHAKKHQKNITRLAKDINGQIKKTHNVEADGLWHSIQEGRIKSPQDSRITHDSIPQDMQSSFQSYVEQHNKKLSADQEFSRSVVADDSLNNLKEKAQTAVSDATSAEQQLEKLKETLAQTKTELEQLKVRLSSWKEKLTAAATQLKHKVVGLKDKMDTAIKSGFDKYQEDETETSAGKAVAIQDFTRVMTQIAGSPDPADNTPDSATSRLLAYLPKDPKTPDTDIDVDPAKTPSKGLQDYFFYHRKTKTESTVPQLDSKIITVRDDHFKGDSPTTMTSPSFVASPLKRDYFGSRKKPDETKPLTPDLHELGSSTTPDSGLNNGLDG